MYDTRLKKSSDSSEILGLVARKESVRIRDRTSRGQAACGKLGRQARPHLKINAAVCMYACKQRCILFQHTFCSSHLAQTPSSSVSVTMSSCVPSRALDKVTSTFLQHKVETTISVSDPYPHPTCRITHIHHKEHPKLAIVIISCQRGNLCAEIAIGGETKIVIRWVYIMEIVIYGILL
jgi:hypothetical protein